MRNVIICSWLILFLVGCNKPETSDNNVNKETIPPIIATENAQTLPTLPVDVWENLRNNVDYIDFIFYSYGQTINQSEEASIKNMIRQITTVPQDDINCTASFCKIIFYKMPDKLLEAEIHYGNGCAYFVFPDKEGKPQFANKMGDFGITFFNDIITKFNGGTAH